MSIVVYMTCKSCVTVNHFLHLHVWIFYPYTYYKSAFAVGTSFSSHMISSSLEVIHPNPSMAGLRLAVQTEEKRARLRLHIAPVVACTGASPARFHRPRCQSFFAKSVFNSTSMVSGTRTTSSRLKFLPIWALCSTWKSFVTGWRGLLQASNKMPRLENKTRIAESWSGKSGLSCMLLLHLLFWWISRVWLRGWNYSATLQYGSCWEQPLGFRGRGRKKTQDSWLNGSSEEVMLKKICCIEKFRTLTYIVGFRG